MTKSKILACLSAALVLAGCGEAEKGRMAKERAEKKYQEAIADYTAGRMDAAVKGFMEVAKSDPSNASARFNLAVLLQETKEDYLGAICHYREYAFLAPDSDKAPLALERAKACEPLLAKALAEKMNLTDNTAIVAERDAALAAKETLEKDCAALRGELEKLSKELEVAKKQNSSREAMLKKMGGLALDDEDDSPIAATPALPANVAEQDKPSALPQIDPTLLEDGKGPLTLNPEAAALNEEAEKDDAVSALLPPQTDANRAAVKLTDTGKTREEEKDDPYAATRPATYVVRSGDTLYKIAKKFYGKRSAWSKIREANKATVPVSGTIKVGQTLILP